MPMFIPHVPPEVLQSLKQHGIDGAFWGKTVSQEVAKQLATRLVEWGQIAFCLVLASLAESARRLASRGRARWQQWRRPEAPPAAPTRRARKRRGDNEPRLF